jgi:taurine dioxygenase
MTLAAEGLVRAVAGRHYSNIDVRPMPGVIGAEVRCGDVSALSDAAAGELRQAWLDHLVLLIRGQRLDDDRLLSFSSRFGALEKGPVTSVQMQEQRHNPYICVVSNVIENGIAIGSLGNDEAIWHTDMSHIEAPPAASVLHALEVPQAGGETGFVNMYFALETLPAEVRERIADLTLRHDGSYNSAGVRRRVATYMDHPIVCTHPETGYDVLYLGRRPHARINGVPEDESYALLDVLWAHATRDAYAWHHAWKSGDILIWDNRCVMHHRNAFDASARRIMHRAQTVGERPARLQRGNAGTPHPRSAPWQ